MAIPAIVGILANLFGSQMNKQGPEANKMQFKKRNTAIGDVAGQPTNQSVSGGGNAAIGTVTGQQQQPPQQGGGFQNGVNKAMTIANILNSLKGSGNNSNQPYQMQFRGR